MQNYFFRWMVVTTPLTCCNNNNDINYLKVHVHDVTDKNRYVTVNESVE